MIYFLFLVIKEIHKYKTLCLLVKYLQFLNAIVLKSHAML